jgi:hypothetical protein
MDNFNRNRAENQDAQPGKIMIRPGRVLILAAQKARAYIGKIQSAKI